MLAKIVAGTLVFASLTSNAFAQTPSPQPSPVVAASPDACPTATTVPTADAFAHAIDDRRTLAFLEFVQNASPEMQNATLLRASKAHELDRADTNARAFDTACADVEFQTRAARLEYTVANRWNARAARDLLRPMQAAIGVLEFPDRLSSGIRDRALAIFGTSIPKLDARIAKVQTPPKPAPRDKPYDPCNTDARVTTPVLPDYPLGARRLGLGGTFRVTVSVDSSGFVTASTLLNAVSPATDEALTELSDESILVAAVSQYAPAFAACKPMPGTYVYRTEFVDR